MINICVLVSRFPTSSKHRVKKEKKKASAEPADRTVSAGLRAGLKPVAGFVNQVPGSARQKSLGGAARWKLNPMTG